MLEKIFFETVKIILIATSLMITIEYLEIKFEKKGEA